MPKTKQEKKQKTNLLITLTVLIVILGIIDLIAIQLYLDKKADTNCGGIIIWRNMMLQ